MGGSSAAFLRSSSFFFRSSFLGFSGSVQGAATTPRRSVLETKAQRGGEAANALAGAVLGAAGVLAVVEPGALRASEAMAKSIWASFLVMPCAPSDFKVSLRPLKRASHSGGRFRICVGRFDVREAMNPFVIYLPRSHS